MIEWIVGIACAVFGGVWFAVCKRASIYPTDDEVRRAKIRDEVINRAAGRASRDRSRWTIHEHAEVDK